MNKQKTDSPPSHAVLHTAKAVAELKSWYASRQGQYALEQLHVLVQGMIADVFGYYALQAGLLAEYCNFLQDSRIGSCFRLSPDPAAQGIDLVADVESLPVAFDNVDLFIGCHLLDYARSPHQVLREIERVLVPEGHCILIGFNPLSFRGMGLGWKLARGKTNVSLYSSFRIRDWFSILGFEIVDTHTIGFRPGWGGESIFRRLEWMDRLGSRYQLPLGNVQIIHARKQVSRLTPIKQKMKARPILQPGIAVNSGTTGRVQRVTQDNEE